MAKVGVTGSFKNINRFLNRMKRLSIAREVEDLARRGVEALVSNTPTDSGMTASSWGYEINTSRGATSITWTNSNIVNGFPVAIMLQYGHGTGTGGWVEGYDYINPAMRKTFNDIADRLWRVVTSA